MCSVIENTHTTKHRARLFSCAVSSSLRCQVGASLERHQVATIAHGSLPAVFLFLHKVFCWNLVGRSRCWQQRKICGSGVGERWNAGQSARNFAPTEHAVAGATTVCILGVGRLKSHTPSLQRRKRSPYVISCSNTDRCTKEQPFLNNFCHPWCTVPIGLCFFLVGLVCRACFCRCSALAPDLR